MQYPSFLQWGSRSDTSPRRRDSLRRSLVAGVFAALVLPAEGQAYLDAGTGSMLVQAVVATIAGGLVLIKSYWSQLKGLFVKNSAAERPAEEVDRQES